MYPALINSIQQHVSLSEGDIAVVSRAFKPVKFKRNSLMIHEGDQARRTYFINSGLVIAVFEDQQGKEHVLQCAREGWWISDFHSYLSASPARANLRAMEPVEALEISSLEEQELFNTVPAYERYKRMLVEKAYAAFQVRTLENLTLSAPERYVEFMKRFPGLDQRLPQKYIAAYLGMSPEFLSKIRNRRDLDK